MEIDKDTVLLDIAGMVNANTMKDDKIATRIICDNLVRFSYEKGLLLKSPFDEQGEIKLETIIKESDLTENGKLIFDDLAEKWFVYTDNESGKIDKKNNIKMLEKYYNNLFSKSGKTKKYEQ